MNQKYICIKNDPNKFSRCHYFTPGKIYDVLFVSGNYFSKNDKLKVKQFSEWMFNSDKFKMVEVNKWRQQQLEKLLDIEPFAPRVPMLERYGSIEVKRDIKIDKLLEL